ncbi:MAG: hypothetical protein JXA69_01430 [Phycisphaerae bacterium]|nr:hypothetical protein [Phycisphaerae bacterium]
MNKEPLFNLSHLDHLGEDVVRDGQTVRLIHIYAEAPDYSRRADPEEGTACVDDAARAAVVYLRHFELTGNDASREKAEGLLRFILHLQAPSGLFFNFVLNNRLEINREHQRSRADVFGWWTARAVWALGTGARILRVANPSLSATCAERVRRTLPYLEAELRRYPQTIEYRGRTVPLWLLHESAADATSELMVGLVALQQAQPDSALPMMIARFAEGMALMRYGSMTTFPYGVHASNRDTWHAWGNCQTQALAEAGHLTSAKLEAEQFYPRVLVEGHLHSIQFDELHAIKYFERIAYGVRCMVVGLIRLHEATGETKYATMAGLAASWFTGNNEAGEPMYDGATGRGYDGLEDGSVINRNAGAESTIESLYSILEAQHCPAARRWLCARALAPCRSEADGVEYYYRIFEVDEAGGSRRAAVVMDLTHERLDVLEDEALETFLKLGG